MKRILLGLAAFSFLSFVGAQTLHQHEKIAQDSCRICLLGGQAVRHAPAAAPAIIAAPTRESVAQEKNVLPDLTRRGETAARAPPHLC